MVQERNESQEHYLSGCRLLYGYGGGELDFPAAVSEFRLAAEGGHTLAMIELGRCLEYGIGVECDFESALEWYGRAASSGDMNGMYERGRCLEHGIGCVPDLAGALDCYRQASESGVSSAQLRYGECLLEGIGCERDLEGALTWLYRAGEAGSVVGLYKSGLCFEDGIGCDRDLDRALSMYRSAASHGHSGAMHRLGRCYEHGIGLDSNIDLALRWYRLSGEQGNVESQRRLGEMYLRGIGVPRDASIGFKWLLRAAEQGDAESGFLVGRCYGLGFGVEQDYDRRFIWWRRSSMQGHPDAQLGLGRCYLSGLGCERNLYEASACFRKAGTLGSSAALEGLTLLDILAVAGSKDDVQIEEQLAPIEEPKPEEVDEPVVDEPVVDEPVVDEPVEVAEEEPEEIPEVAPEEELVDWSDSTDLEGLESAAEAGNAVAAYRLGSLYEAGELVTCDDDQAVRWYEIAAKAGDTRADARLGVLFGRVDWDGADPVLSFKHHLIAAESGDPDSQYAVSQCYEKGIGVGVDEEQARHWLERARESGSAEACFRIGRDLIQSGDEEKARQGLEYLRHASSKTESLLLLGDCHRDGIGVECDVEAARKYYESAVSSGCIQGYARLGRLKSAGLSADSPEWSEVVSYYESGACRGDGDCKYELSRCLEAGLGCEVDKDRSRELLEVSARKDCVLALHQIAGEFDDLFANAGSLELPLRAYHRLSELGDVPSRRRYGEILLHGLGVPSERESGYIWLDRAARIGDVQSCYSLGRELITDSEHLEYGVELLYKASSGGHAEAMFLLGDCLLNGVGCEASAADAFKAYKRSASAGSMSGLCALGRCYESGIGCTEDSERAAECYRKAADGGNPRAKICLQRYEFVLPGAGVSELDNYALDELGLEMIWCRPGEFQMGSPKGWPVVGGAEKGRSETEVQHLVSLSNGFWLCKYPLHQSAFAQLASKCGLPCHPSRFRGGRHPVENVNWDEAVAWCKALTRRERHAGRLPDGYVYRLPTEAEWEYACRAGTETAFNDGTNLEAEERACPNLAALGWYGDNSNGATHPVGLMKPNAWGFYDMHGNVWEWCHDKFGEYPKGSKKVVDPIGPETGSRRVRRGGAWNEPAKNCRSACRNFVTPTLHRDYIGFRLALGPVLQVED